jgi:hypothetical protein
MSELEINTHISMPECTIRLSWDDLRESSEVKAFLASPEGKRRAKMSFTQKFFPDMPIRLLFVGCLPFQIILILVDV